MSNRSKTMPEEPMEPLRNDPNSTCHDETVTWLASGDQPNPLTTMERARRERQLRRSSASPRPELLEQVRHGFLSFNPHDDGEMEADVFRMDVAEIRDRLPESVLSSFDHYRHFVEGHRWGFVRLLARYMNEDRVLVVAVRATHGGYLEIFDAHGMPLLSGRKFQDEAICWDGEFGACRESVIYDD
tara:strand:- start:675 stop:1232 length:558 start_codon:yes stop_codon:yes gene_type:complete